MLFSVHASASELRAGTTPQAHSTVCRRSTEIETIYRSHQDLLLQETRKQGLLLCLGKIFDRKQLPAVFNYSHADRVHI
jgi:hypothetical protein